MIIKWDYIKGNYLFLDESKMGYIQKIKKNIKNESILCFDLDGTLINTDEANFLSYKEAVLEVKNIDLESLYRSNYRFTQENLYQLMPLLTLQEYQDIVMRKKDLYGKYLNKTTINIKILAVIEKFSKTHKIILVTNSSQTRANQILQYHNLIDIFDYKFFKEDYNNKLESKFKYVLEALNINPKQIFIFENDKKEIEQALVLNIPLYNLVNVTI